MLIGCDTKSTKLATLYPSPGVLAFPSYGVCKIILRLFRLHHVRAAWAHGNHFVKV